MRKYVIILLTIIAFMFVGCAPAQFEPYKPPKIEFEKTEQYNPDFSELQKPEKPNFIYLDGDFQPVEEPSKAKYVALANPDLKKILTLSKQYDAQMEVIKNQKDLVNVHIDQINALKELVKLKEAQMEQYISMYATAKNQYLQERYDHRIDNLIKDGTMYLMTIGSVIVAIVAL